MTLAIFKRRIKSWRLRRAKSAGLTWLNRWNGACARCQARLGEGEPSAAKFARFERHHERLVRLVVKKTMSM